MKAQNFGFMKELAPKIINGTKRLTNRSATDFRGKLDVGGIMHCFTGLRTKNTQKICDAKVIQRVKWYFVQVPLHPDNIAYRSPLEFLSWYDFARKDGFEKYQDFVDYFFFHKQRDLGFYCYLFEVIDFE